MTLNNHLVEVLTDGRLGSRLLHSFLFVLTLFAFFFSLIFIPFADCPMAMTIHADLAARHVQSFAGKHDDAPFVLAGDFNIKPSEPVYQYLTTGLMDHDSPFYPTPKNGMEWTPTLEGKLNSAYAVLQGKEPDFTNYAQSRDSEPFIETLDYIFCSPEWKVERVLEIPDRADAQGPFPNLDVKEPSDHVLIAADLTHKPEF